jgi:hypothetical protein
MAARRRGIDRVSRIRTATGFALEERREDLRDRRWRRHRDQLRIAARVLIACCVALGLPHMLSLLLRVL